MTVNTEKIFIHTEKSETIRAEAKLYFNFGSSCSWRVCTALQFKGIEFEIISMTSDLIKQDSFSEKNPLNKLPSLEIDGIILHQTKAIIEYLEETRPEPPLLPLKPADRWVVRCMVDMVSCDIQPLQNKAVQAKVCAGEAWAREWICNGFKGLEKMLKQYRGQYSFGDCITMADVFIFPQIVNARSYGVDMRNFPNICAIETALSEHQLFHRESRSV